MTSPETGNEAWGTVDEVLAAKARFTAAIPGYTVPVAYSVARRDDDGFVFAHVNDVGGTHELPAVVLATVCGRVSGNGSLDMTYAQFAEAIELLAPAEACTAFDHPNLWSWRPLLESSTIDDEFVAVFIDDVDVAPTSEAETALRGHLGR